MAGSVTGNIGSENVTLRNMATEDTLEAIFDVLTKSKITDSNVDKDNKRRISSAADRLANTAKSMKDIAEIFKGVGTGAYKIVRGLESNIENVSFTFSTIAGELRKESSALAKFFGFASESVAMLQEQQNAYSRMVQVGAATSEEFSNLGVQATELGTDVRGVTELVDKFGFSLKIGSTSVSGGLKNLRNVFKEVTPDLINQFGRLGIAPQKVTEQMLLAAEASGGFGDVMKRYGNDYKAFGQSMLRSTRELNIFATAIGSNSRAMMEEMAKANQQITNRLFMRTLNDGEKAATNFLQSMTGSAEIAIAVMKSRKGEATTAEAALFESLKSFTGIGNEIDSFVDILARNGGNVEEALNKSGLLAATKNISEEAIQIMRRDVDAYRATPGMEAQAKFLEQQLLMITGLRDAKPEELKKIISNLKDNLSPDGKTLDSFTQLQNNQIKLAHTTAGVNRQLNRLGLAIATSSLKLADLGLEAGGNTLQSARKYFNQMLESYGINIEIPDDIMNKGINEMEAWVEKLLNVGINQAVVNSNNTPVSSDQSASNRLTVNARTAAGENRELDVTETVNNNLIKKLTEALKGTDNQAGTLILGAMLQKQLKSTGRATSDPSLITSENSKESALGFKVKELEGKNLDESAKLTKDAIVNSLMNDFGLKKDQFRIIDEKTNNGESLVKVQIIDPTISASLRNDAQNILKQYQDNAQTQTRTNTEVSVPRVNAENVAVPVAGTVNNNVSVVSFVKPDWWDGAMKSANEGTMSAVKNLEGAFSRLTDMLKQNLQK